MELEKTLTVAAPRQHVWDLLLDPKIMAGCVPGTQSVEVLSDLEYLAEIRVKISFIAARFKIKTRIVESRAPDYLRIEGTGEDSSVASSMKQTSELFLTDLGDDTTEIRIKAHADVLGRLGSFGLSVMKTKADRMWDEFGANFSAVALRALPPVPAATDAYPLDAPVRNAPTGLRGTCRSWPAILFSWLGDTRGGHHSGSDENRAFRESQMVAADRWTIAGEFDYRRRGSPHRRAATNRHLRRASSLPRRHQGPLADFRGLRSGKLAERPSLRLTAPRQAPASFLLGAQKLKLSIAGKIGREVCPRNRIW